MPMLAGRFVLTLPARISPRKGQDDFLALIAAAVSNLVLCLSKVPEAFGRTTLDALSLGVHEILTRVFPEGRTPTGDLPAT